MQFKHQKFKHQACCNVQTEYDADLPDANAVMAAICCASSQYAVHPSVELAMLIEDLAYKLSAPEYAESPLIEEVASRLLIQWSAIVDNGQAALLDGEPLTASYH